MTITEIQYKLPRTMLTRSSVRCKLIITEFLTYSAIIDAAINNHHDKVLTELHKALSHPLVTRSEEVSWPPPRPLRVIYALSW